MTAMRTVIENAVAEIIAEHPKYFTPRGLEYAQATFTRKIAAALRESLGITSEKTETTTPAAKIDKQPFQIVSESSREGRGYALLRQLAGAVRPIASGQNYVVNSEAFTPAVWALGDAPPPRDWVSITDKQQIGAWMEFFEKTLPSTSRRYILSQDKDRRALLVPWPWPPRADGAVDPPLIEEFA